MTFIKPQRLSKGDTVAIVSPSWGGPSVFPHVYEEGLKVLKEFGLNIKEYPTARADASYLRENPKMRAEDINKAFSDKEVKAIFASIGGTDSVRILPYLDKAIIKKNPKLLMGYSDTTTLHTFCNQLGFVTYYGPSIMAGLSQTDSLPKEFKEHLKYMLFDTNNNYEYKAYEEYADGYPDWTNKEDLGKVNQLKKNEGWQWLQGNKETEGELFGGCMEVLSMMKGTPFWPQPDFWKGKIFFLETSEDKPPIHQVDHELRNYGAMGVFDQINGLLIARARDYSDEEKEELNKVVVSIVADEFGRKDLPIIANMDFGHTDPQFILPLGAKAKIDPKNKKFSLLESPLED